MVLGWLVPDRCTVVLVTSHQCSNSKLALDWCRGNLITGEGDFDRAGFFNILGMIIYRNESYGWTEFEVSFDILTKGLRANPSRITVKYVSLWRGCFAPNVIENKSIYLYQMLNGVPIGILGTALCHKLKHYMAGENTNWSEQSSKEIFIDYLKMNLEGAWWDANKWGNRKSWHLLWSRVQSSCSRHLLRGGQSSI